METSEKGLRKKEKKRKNNDPESKAEGKIFYLHGKFIQGYPRITLAGYLNEKKKEIHFGIAVCDPRDQFVRKIGRVRAMGRAVSSTRRIIRVKSIDPKYIRNRLAFVLSKEELISYQRAILENPGLASPVMRRELAARVITTLDEAK